LFVLFAMLPFPSGTNSKDLVYIVLQYVL